MLILGAGLLLLILLCCFLGRIAHAGQPRSIEDVPHNTMLIHYQHYNITDIESVELGVVSASYENVATDYLCHPDVAYVEIKDEHGNVFTFHSQHE